MYQEFNISQYIKSFKLIRDCLSKHERNSKARLFKAIGVTLLIDHPNMTSALEAQLEIWHMRGYTKHYISFVWLRQGERGSRKNPKKYADVIEGLPLINLWWDQILPACLLPDCLEELEEVFDDGEGRREAWPGVALLDEAVHLPLPHLVLMMMMTMTVVGINPNGQNPKW